MTVKSRVQFKKPLLFGMPLQIPCSATNFLYSFRLFTVYIKNPVWFPVFQKFQYTKHHEISKKFSLSSFLILNLAHLLHRITCLNKWTHTYSTCVWWPTTGKAGKIANSMNRQNQRNCILRGSSWRFSPRESGQKPTTATTSESTQRW